MRGKLELEPGAHVLSRIIPAHAGQTQLGYALLSERSDHPRACGANGTPCSPNNCHAGSSPRMRGKRGRLVAVAAARRIIPAHAGQTIGALRDTTDLADHPRACGANLTWREARRVRSGSSPRMRGKHQNHAWRQPHTRIIPAHAGQTASLRRAPPLPPDHPRACGANSLIPLAKRTPTIREKFDLHSRSHFANVIMVPNFLMSTRNPQFNIATTTIYQNGDIVMHCSNLFYEMHPEISRWIHPDHEAS